MLLCFPLPSCSHPGAFRYAEFGCEAVLATADFNSHVGECRYAPQPCRWPGCPFKTLTVATFDTHVAECGFRPVRCRYDCGLLVPVHLEEQHIALECKNVECECEHGCGQRIRRRLYLQHAGHECPESIISCSVIGCGAVVKRKDLPAHIEQSMAVHFALLSRSVQDLHNQLGSAQQYIRHLESRMWSAKRPTIIHANPFCVSVLARSRDGNWLFAGADDGIIWVWDCTKPDIEAHSMTLYMLTETKNNSVWTLFADSKYLFAGRKEGQVEIWYIGSDSMAAITRLVCFTAHAKKAVYTLTATETRLFTGSDDRSIRVWDLSLLAATNTVTFLCVLNGHGDTVYSLVASDALLFSSSWDCTIRVWSIANDTISCLQELRGHAGMTR